MQVRHLASLGFLLGWAFCVLTDPAKDTQHKVTYNVCDTPVCVERARLINESLNVSVDPCTDFYSYACGGWMSKHKIPESKPVTGTFILLDDELRGTLRDILGNMTLVCENQNITDKAAIVYNACVAVPDLEDRHDVVLAIMNDSGLAQWPKTRQDKCKKTDALNPTDVLIQTRISTILSSAVSRDSQNLSAYVIQLDQLAFSAVGRNQLINQTTNYSKPIIAAYKKVIEVAMKFMKPNLTDSELSELSGILLAFERKLANMTAPPEKRRDLIKLYHRTTIDELERNFSYVPIRALLQNEFCRVNITLAHNETVELFALEYYKKLNEFLKCADTDTLYNYAGLRRILKWAATGSQEFRNASLELRKVKAGVRVEKPRWQLCVDEVNDAMAESVGYLYVQRKFSGKAKEEVEDLTRRIMAAFNESLHTLKWMDNKTRAAAETKLSKMGTKIGYPNWLFNTTYIENLYNFVPKLSLNAPYGEMMYSIAQNNWKQELLKLRKPYDKDAEWIVGAAVVNAFYSASSNEMVFPSGILQGVFYEHGLPRSINFGAVGMVVGHEMTHGFDDKGSQFDAEGALKQWWTNETRAEFMKRTKCFVYEYGNITDKEANMTLNAKNTVGENIADNGGLRMAFEAYSQLLEKKYKRVDTRLKGLEDVSGKQLFFLSNAMVWCRLCRREYLKLQIQYDPHSPGPYRVNVPMSNLKAFSETFNCPANSTMNRKDRCSLW
ncbi:neprilysin-1-like isoform X1 [Dermacentor variabilis]|uniref:neprilysin-1-like isoform X1 n=1 Tax=Dermacentor variabilis TaxID=34621 RepID=UPI003F5B7948